LTNLICVGSLGLDTLETPFERAERVLGGSAPYFALAAKLYTDVGIVAVIGDDYPERHIDLLDKKGVNLDGLQRSPGESFFWEARYHYDMNSRDTLETKLGVFADFQPKLPDSYRSAEYVFLANILPTLQMAVQEQVQSPKLTVLDSMNLWIETAKDSLTEAMRRSNILTINDQEARQYAETSSLLAAARAIMKNGPGGVIIKKGEHGVIYVSNQGVFGAPALLLEEVKDPTGAGDSFAGGFMGYLASRGPEALSDNVELRRAMTYGSVLASFNVEEFGTERVARLTRKEIDERYSELRRMTSLGELS
jgi:sugar/nucleoside kinase (ribokinase family)